NETTFTGELTFSGKTTFEAEVAFHNAHFKDLFTFDGDVVFKKSFEAYNCHFFEQVRLDNVTLSNVAVFNDSKFDGLASFIATKFFGRGTYFERATFSGVADFEQVAFDGKVLFNDAIFKKKADFSAVLFNGETSFRQSQFLGTTYFSFSEITNVAFFDGASFAGDAHFDSLNMLHALRKSDENFKLTFADPPPGKLIFSATNFQGRVYFDDSNLFELSLSNQTISGQRANPTIFEKRFIAQNLKCSVCDFTEVEFRDYTTFSGARFKQSVSFAGASFSDEVDFYRCQFPARVTDLRNESTVSGGVSLAKTRFEKNVHLDYDQLTESPSWWQVWRGPKTRLVGSDTITWATLE